jgi:hypothetical protein
LTFEISKFVVTEKVNIASGFSIIGEPAVDVPKRGNEVTDREYDDNEAGNSEQVAHNDLSHDIVVVLQRICSVLTRIL